MSANYPGVEDYRDLKAAFFDDEASVYEDLIKPRPGARTIEDLRDQLAEIQSRAQMLKRSGERLLSTDKELRRQYSVHADRHTDGLWAYISHRQGMPGK